MQLIDGGTENMNGIEAAVREAEEQGYHKNNIFVLSIGAGMYDFAATNGKKSTEDTRSSIVNHDSSVNPEESDKINSQLFWPEPLNNVGYCESAQQSHLWAKNYLGDNNYMRL